MPAAFKIMQHWYVIRSKPHREWTAHNYLRQLGCQIYLPALPVDSNQPSRVPRTRVCFPGYLFVQTDLAVVGISRLRWIPATHGLLEFGGVPAIIPDDIMTQLRSRISALQTQATSTPVPFNHGDRVIITDGPFAGYEAIFDLSLRDNKRIKVLINFLQHHVHLELNIDQLRPA